MRTKKASVLIYAVSAITAFMLAGLVIGKITILDIKRFSNFEKGLKAYYLAESDLEYRLWKVKQNLFLDICKDKSKFETECVLFQPKEIYIPYLKAQDVYQIDYLDFNDNMKDLKEVFKVKISADPKVSPSEILIIYNTWDKKQVKRAYIERIVFNTKGTQIVSLQKSFTKGILRIKALDNDFGDIKISFLDSSDNKINFTSPVVIKSYATVLNNRKYIQAYVPYRKKISPKFDFVIFSIEDIIK